MLADIADLRRAAGAHTTSPDEVSAHILYVARLCKERMALGRSTHPHTNHALAKGIVEMPAGALDAARFRPGLEAVYAKLRASK